MNEITDETPIEEIDFSTLGFCAIDPEELIEYVPPMARDYPKNIQPRFFFKIMTGKQAAKLQDKIMRMEVRGKKKGGNQVMFSSATVACEAVKENLARWENMYDREGNIVEFDKSAGIIKNMERLNARIILELGEYIINGKDLGEQEKED